MTMLGIKEIRELQKNGKARRTQGLFIVEGIKMFRETPRERISQVCVSESFLKDHADEVDGLLGEGLSARLSEADSVRLKDGTGVMRLSDSRMKTLSDTRSPQGILLAVRKREWEIDAILDKDAPFLILLENVQDPGNLGRIVRTAEAAGADGVFMTEGCADIYNPKVIRSTMGSIYRVPHCVISGTTDLLTRFLERDIISYAAYLDTEISYLDGDYKKGTCFFIGNESRGLSDELLNQSDRLIHIPMKGQVESLNAAMAAGILMFEDARQRAQKQ